jgi:hypothetical protein
MKIYLFKISLLGNLNIFVKISKTEDLEMARYPDDQSDTDIVEKYMKKVSLYKGQHAWCHRTDIVLDILL